MKKFRFVILAHWLVNTYAPCRVADVGGGKGLLSYILNKAGWDCTVIDPEKQQLLTKYRDIYKKKCKIDTDKEKVKYIQSPYVDDYARDYDLIIGLHAHGCNMQIINSAKKYNKNFILLPCCVIDEPIVKMRDINWRESLFDYALKQGLDVKKIQFNFKGKNIAVYTDDHLRKIGSLSDADKKEYIIDPIRDEYWEEGAD